MRVHRTRPTRRLVQVFAADGMLCGVATLLAADRRQVQPADLISFEAAVQLVAAAPASEAAAQQLQSGAAQATAIESEPAKNISSVLLNGNRSQVAQTARSNYWSKPFGFTTVICF